MGIGRGLLSRCCLTASDGRVTPTEAADTENAMGNKGPETFKDFMENQQRDVQVKRLGKTELHARQITTRRAPISQGGNSRNTPGFPGSPTGNEPVGECYRISGIQEKKWKKIKRNAFPHAEPLDLHGYNRSEALAELRAYLDSCSMKKEPYAVVIHGKGFRSSTGGAVLKDLTLRFLVTHSQVQAFCPTVAGKGGSGATYVKLKL